MVNTGRLGRTAEMRAFLWLAAQGYEVFDNVFPNGPVDLVAMDRVSGEMFKFEVRTASLTPSGKRGFARLTAEQVRLGIKLLAYKPDIDEFEIIDDERAYPRDCRDTRRTVTGVSPGIGKPQVPLTFLGSPQVLEARV